MSDNAGTTSFFDNLKQDENLVRKQEEMSIQKYLELCAKDSEAVANGESKYPLSYATYAERFLDAIGEPNLIDTSKDTSKDSGRLRNLFGGEIIAEYDSFKDFYGMNDVIQGIVSFMKGAAAKQEQSKQVLYLLGPVGGGKSSLGERVKQIMEERPIYVLKCKKTNKLSPVQDSPLALFAATGTAQQVSSEYGIPERYMKMKLSPWAIKRLDAAGGIGNAEDAFEVVKVWPSKDRQLGISKVVPGDDNNQDTSTLVGKVDINKLGEGLDQNDPDAYLYSGGLSTGNQGMMEFTEMFKAPIKTLNPMLEALQDGSYEGTENIGSMPFYGLILAHSNESEWEKFASDSKNEAFLDRIELLRVPYTLSYEREEHIYNKKLNEGSDANAPLAPKTLEILAKFSVLTRLSQADSVAKYDAKTRMIVHNGDIPDGASSSAPTYRQLKKAAPLEEGMKGSSTRFAFKTLSETFNAKANEGLREADPVLLFEVLRKRIKQDSTISEDNKSRYISYIDDILESEYAEFARAEIEEVYTGASEQLCQNIFDRYFKMARAWLLDRELDDRDVTGDVLRKPDLDAKLAALERSAGISNPETFRNEFISYVLNQREDGNDVKWDSYKPMARAIRKELGRNMEDMAKVIRFDSIKDEQEQAEHQRFMTGMKEKGYTPTMVQRMVQRYG